MTWLPAMMLLAQTADFRDPRWLSLTGEAQTHNEVLRLTRAEENQKGAAWRKERMPVSGGFDTAFRFRLTECGGLGDGADGIAFVIQNNGPKELGGYGGSAGFMADGKDQDRRRRARSISNSLAVFFDTFQNGELDDPSDNFVAVITNGTKSQWPSPRLAINQRVQPVMKDGQVHQARIVFRPPLLDVYLDDERVLRTPVDIARMIGGDGKAYVGLTAATGGGYANHDILDWVFTSADSLMTDVSSEITFAKFDCMRGKNLCTPEAALVEPRGAGVFHVILPAHLAWQASIPNPGGKPVVFRKLAGHVCWDAAASGCGPAKADLIGQRIESGRTRFAVSGADPRKSEGFAEFEAVVIE